MMLNKFQLNGKVAIITGGAGMLGRQHAKAVEEIGGIPVLWDIDEEGVKEVVEEINGDSLGMKIDITRPEEIQRGLKEIVERFGKVDILINNAANDPEVINGDSSWSRLENFDLDMWNKDILVGLTGSFLCSKIVGQHIAETGGGVILNISSDLGLIAPDQRIYRRQGLADNEQPAKPVTYSVVKHGLMGLTKYLSTYWAHKGVRVNAICPGGVYSNQSEDFVHKLTELIPMGRMAKVDEYRCAIQFLISDASSYMTGSTLAIDGGRTVL